MFNQRLEKEMDRSVDNSSESFDSDVESVELNPLPNFLIQDINITGQLIQNEPLDYSEDSPISVNDSIQNQDIFASITESPISRDYACS